MRPVFWFASLLLSTFTASFFFFSANPDSSLDSLKRFSQVLDIVERHYVKDTPRKDLITGALKGMLQALDPHSTLLSPSEYKEMQENTSGEFVGVGIEISQENNQLVIVAPIEDTPGHKAGLKPGDFILSINGETTQDMSMQEAVSRIRGPKGTEVELTVMHRDAKSPRTVRITRDTIPLISVKSRVLEEGYYWLRLTRFSGRTTDELHEALKEAGKKGAVKGIVLDLRNNPGGVLEQAVSVSDTFLKSGDIVSIRGRNNEKLREYKAKPHKTDVYVPMVVLINAGSASASEIVAGALGDQKRALILGERSFGKGSVQNIIELADGSGLKLTVALYYTPSGRSIQAEGIQPDIEIPFEPSRDAEGDGKKPPRMLVREKDLTRHLETNATRPGKPDAKPELKVDGKMLKDAERPAPPESEAKEQLSKDNQLRMALQFVKNLPKMRELQNPM
ncbi:MAG: S41 family peptidase [Deltaproteobacteria bacterium]|jgi:carboxyl-terminal processing protease|nr:S41 family peptidase [Deltaproteobacteria bacterium]